MINIIGKRRFMILLALLGFNILVAAAIYLMLAPANEKLQSDLRSVTGKIAASRSNIDNMRNQFQIIQQQKEQFTKLQATDFFTTQDRVQARDRFTAIQRYSKVVLASYDMKAASTEHTQALTDAGQIMLTTPVDVSVDAMDDMDFYNFLFLVKNAFPGYVAIDNIELTRDKDIDDVTLRQIGSGIPTVLIKGKIAFTWKTIVPEKQMQLGTAQQAGM
jgi:hypothetical protein